MEEIMSKILCSTGCLIGRPNGRNYHLIREFVKELNYDGMEFMMYSDWYPEVDALLEELLALPVQFPVMHCQKSVGEAISLGGAENWKDAFSRFEINCKIAKKIGARKMVMHLWDGITSDHYFENNLKAYGELQLPEVAADYGVDLLVENVVCNVEDPMHHFCQLVVPHTSDLPYRKLLHHRCRSWKQSCLFLPLQRQGHSGPLPFSLV